MQVSSYTNSFRHVESHVMLEGHMLRRFEFVCGINLGYSVRDGTNLYVYKDAG